MFEGEILGSGEGKEGASPGPGDKESGVIASGERPAYLGKGLGAWQEERKL